MFPTVEEKTEAVGIGAGVYSWKNNISCFRHIILSFDLPESIV